LANSSTTNTLITLNSEYSPLQTDWIAVNKQSHRLFFKQKKVLTYQNKTFVVWNEFNDDEEDNYTIWYQIYNADGLAVLPFGGKKLSSSSCDQFINEVQNDQNGNLLVYWNEKSAMDNTFQSRVQIIDSNNLPVFDDEGLLLFRGLETVNTPAQMYVEGNVSFYYVEKNENILGQKLLNHQIQWPDGGKEILPGLFGAVRNITLIPVDLKQNILTWKENRSSNYYNHGFRTLKLNENGSPAEGWLPEGNESISGDYMTIGFSGSPEAFRAVRFANYNLFIYDKGESYSNLREYYYQIVDDYGFALYEVPQSLFTQYHYKLKDVFVTNSEIIIKVDYCGGMLFYKYNFDNVLAPVWDIPVEINSEIVQVQYPMDQIDNHFILFYLQNNSLSYQFFSPEIQPINSSIPLYTDPVSLLGQLDLYKIDNNHFITTWVNDFWVYTWSDEYPVTQTFNIQKHDIPDLLKTSEIDISPANFTLRQNYPNPFNPSTRINYSLKSAGKTDLSIYNIKGQKIKSLVNNCQPAGSHEVIWDGSDSQGKQVASGIYFYRLSSGDNTQTRKMILMK